MSIHPLAARPVAVFSTAPPNQPSRVTPSIEIRQAILSSELMLAADIIVPAYYRVGYVEADDQAVRRKMCQSLEDYHVFIARADGEDLATLSLNIGQELPMEKTKHSFEKELKPFREQGYRIGELGKFARRATKRAYRATYYLQAAVFIAASQLVEVAVVRVNPDDLDYYENGVKFTCLDPEPHWDDTVKDWAFGMYTFPKPIVAARDPAKYRGRIRPLHASS